MSKSVYLCGAMESLPDNGKTWRDEYKKTLHNEFGFRCISPNDEEEELIKGVDISYLKRFDKELYTKYVKEFIKMDLKFVENVDMLVCKWDGEKITGTVHEIGYAYQLGKPVYLITTVDFVDMAGWLIGCVSKIFSSFEEFKDYLYDTYK